MSWNSPKLRRLFEEAGTYAYKHMWDLDKILLVAVGRALN